MRHNPTRIKLIAALEKHGTMSAAEAGKAIGKDRRVAREALGRMVEKDIAEVRLDNGKPEYSLKGRAKPLADRQKFHPIHNYADPFALPREFFGACV